MKISGLTKKAVVLLVILSFLVQPFLARPVYAQSGTNLPDLVAGIAFCVVSGWISQVLDWVLDAFENLWNAVRSRIGGFIDRIINFVRDTVPITVERDKPATATEAQDCISAGAKRLLIGWLINDSIDWMIRGGKPRFIQDFKDEFKRIADGEAALYVSRLTGVDICDPFEVELKAIIGHLATPPDLLRGGKPRYSCTITTALANQALANQNSAVDAFYNDFRYGGWDTWILLNRPENTFSGSYRIVKADIEKEAAEAEEAAKAEAVANSGYDATKKCKELLIFFSNGSNKTYYGPLEVANDLHIPIDENTWTINGESIGWPFTFTGLVRNYILTQGVEEGVQDATCSSDIIISPGKIIADTVTKVTNSELENLINSDKWYEIVAGLLTRSIFRISDFGFTRESRDNTIQTDPNTGKVYR